MARNATWFCNNAGLERIIGTNKESSVGRMNNSTPKLIFSSFSHFSRQQKDQ